MAELNITIPVDCLVAVNQVLDSTPIPGPDLKAQVSNFQALVRNAAQLAEFQAREAETKPKILSHPSESAQDAPGVTGLVDVHRAMAQGD